MPILTASDGQPLHFADEGAGPAILLVHGWSAHGGYFGPQRVALQRRFRVVTPDLRGHRRSRRAGGRPAMADLARDLREVLDYLDLEGVVAVGWSMGATALFEYLATFGPHRLGGLVIEDMTARIVNDETWSLGVRDGFTAEHSAVTVAAMRANWPAYAAALSALFFADTGCRDPKLPAWVDEQVADNDPDLLASLWQSMAESDFRDLMPRLDLPVVVADGARSRVYTPATGDWMAAAIPGARRVTFAKSGHSPHLEEADAFTRMLAAFADEVRSAPGS
ncbi:MAG: alpha/beta hydrolase [Hyphomicrobiales bacterium]|nr:alpha/beta hydrolase [Hyphomicrobiales bacterium]MCP5370713.1 alpha/beta hydrolase [Hyphomicrobiales bacterium]